MQEGLQRHIARELHDEIGQTLTGLKLLFETPPGAKVNGDERLHRARGMVMQLMSYVRNLSLDLRPTILDDLGLLPALRFQIERFESQTGLKVHLRHQGIERRFSSEVETAAYRIVQEALTNIARHSGASAIQVRVAVQGGMLSVEVSDNGRGFDVEQAGASLMSSGLTGMRERAAALGGTFDVQSEPGKGSRLTVVLPTEEDTATTQGMDEKDDDVGALGGRPRSGPAGT
jgi:signal transduction histidine kinase